MGNGEIVSVPDGQHRVAGASRSTGVHGLTLQLDVDGRDGLMPLSYHERLPEGTIVTVEDNEVVNVERPQS